MVHAQQWTLQLTLSIPSSLQKAAHLTKPSTLHKAFFQSRFTMTDAAWKRDLPLKVTNVVTFLIFLSSNAYSSLVPQDARYGAGPNETYITPESWSE
jgi:hypothetical protein